MQITYVINQMYADSNKYFMSDTADVVGFDDIADAVNNIAIHKSSRGISSLKDIEILYRHMKDSLKRLSLMPPIIYTNDIRFKKFSKSTSDSIVVYKKEFKTSYLCYNGISQSTDCAILYSYYKWVINPLVKNMVIEIFLENNY